MNSAWRQSTIAVLVLSLVIPPAPARAADSGRAKNIIIFVGDGMGLEHIKAGGLFLNGASGTMLFESFPHKGTMGTNNYQGAVTDSAASATAMACGIKVSNGVVSKRIPGDSSDMETVLEVYKARGKRTGLVTTAEFVDATPAGFGAHDASRNNKAAIFNDYVTSSRPNVLFGAWTAISSMTAAAAGYPIVTDRASLNALDKNATTEVAGFFRNSSLLQWEVRRVVDMAASSLNQPGLTELTVAALDILDNDPDGFFLLVENENIDEVGHGGAATGRSRMETLVWEMKVFEASIQAALTWAQARPEQDTLIVVVADHECGNLTVTDTSVTPGTVPAGAFASTGHTAKPVGVFAWGPGAAQVALVSENTDIRTLLLPATPEITLEPADRAVEAGQSASFSVAAAGTTGLTYQWQRNGSAVIGATGTTLTVSAAASDDGARFRCVVTNALGEALSREATLSVSTPPLDPVNVQAGTRGFLDLRAGGQVGVPYDTAASGGVTLEIYSLRGERLRELHGDTPGGSQSIGWDGRDDSGRLVGPGVYLFRLAAPGVNRTGKIITLD